MHSAEGTDVFANYQVGDEDVGPGRADVLSILALNHLERLKF